MSNKLTQQEVVLQIETYLAENYNFRNNSLSGKTEVRQIAGTDSNKNDWKILTDKEFNTIVRQAKLDGIGGDSSPRQNIEEYILSSATPEHNPVMDFISHLPAWDGKNHMAELFSRIPGINTEQLSWCCTWFRSAVAHWMQKDKLHGNEIVPILIGAQGCGKSTFANRLLPEHLRCYYLSRINFGNKFDRDMALANNLLVNIDEFDRFGASQQAHLKQAVSEAKVNGRPIFGKSQEDRLRYASFIATTNAEKPLTDPTGSRRYICLHVHHGQFIDNLSPINYDQLYAQAVYEVNADIPFWFSNVDVERIQKANLPYFKCDDMESMITACYRLPESDEEGEWLTSKEVCLSIGKLFPNVQMSNSTKIRIGQTLKLMGCQSKRKMTGMVYRLVANVA